MDWRLTYWRALLGVVLGGAFLGGAVYARKVEPEEVEVVSISLALPRLDVQFDGYRIAQISDIHADDWMTPGRFSRLVDLVNAEKPDLVLITGDFATYSRWRSKIHHVPDLVAPLRRLLAPDGSFAVLGNHDHETNAQVIRRVLAASGVPELCNTVRTLYRGEAELHLCGADSALEGVSCPERVLERLPEEGAAILLAHEPDVADEVAATGRFDLQLSGHSHGGQMGLPLLRFPFLPKRSRKYPIGLYRLDKMFLYVNRGLGAHPRFRFACRPEVTILTLRV
jgi:predicted MPP superfamily phosphohydrolase